MRESTSQITLRVPADVRAALDQLCVQLGVTRRALFEAVITIAFEDAQDPTWAPAQERLWAAAKALEESGKIQARPRDKVILHLDPTLAERFRKVCRERGVSQNAVLAMTLMAHPGEDGAEGKYHAHAVARVVPLARQLDHRRRTRSR